MCEHDLVIKDSFIEGVPAKITVCKKCADIIKVNLRQGMKMEEEVAPVKKSPSRDVSIGRMSVLKGAIDLSIAREDFTTENVFKIAEELEGWIYRAV